MKNFLVLIALVPTVGFAQAPQVPKTYESSVEDETIVRPYSGRRESGSENVTERFTKEAGASVEEMKASIHFTSAEFVRAQDFTEKTARAEVRPVGRQNSVFSVTLVNGDISEATFPDDWKNNFPTLVRKMIREGSMNVPATSLKSEENEQN